MYPIWFSPEEEKLIEDYAQLAGMTVPEVICRFTIERVRMRWMRISSVKP